MCSTAGVFTQHFAAAAPKALLAINELSCLFKIIPSTSPNVHGPIDHTPPHPPSSYYIVINVAFCAERWLSLKIPGYFPY